MRPVMLYDGRCYFCNAVVLFIIAHEWTPELKFASLQSKAGLRLLGDRAGEFKDIEQRGSFAIADEQGTIHSHFAATLHMFRLMGGPWRYFGLFCSLFVPTFIGNACYSLGWRYRYKIMGSAETCLVPKAALKARLVEDGDVYD